MLIDLSQAFTRHFSGPFIFLFHFLLIYLCADPAHAAETTKKVVVLFSYEKGFWAVEDENRGIVEGLATMGYVEGRNAKIIRIYMNTKTENKTAAMMEAVAPLFFAKIKALLPDLLIIMDDDALRHVGAKFLDTDLPIVFGGVNLFPTDNDYGWVSSTERKPMADSMLQPGHNVTGVVERIAIGAGLNLLHQINPKIKSALFLSDRSHLSHQMLRAADHNSALSAGPVKIVKQVFTDDYEELKQLVLDYQDRVESIVVFLPWTLVDSNGGHVPYQTVVRWLLENNKRPGIAYLDVLAEGGFLCGVVVDLVQQGVHAGIMAGRILGGEAPKDIPIINPVANRIMINLARAKQLNIDIPFEVLKSSDVLLKTMTALPEYNNRD